MGLSPRRIYFDKTEIVCMDLAGKRYQTVTLIYSDIQRVQISQAVERSLLRRVESEQISIVTSKARNPITNKKGENKKYRDEYKSKITGFAERNSITFQNDFTDGDHGLSDASEKRRISRLSIPQVCLTRLPAKFQLQAEKTPETLK